ncbi:hypothetical protein [Ochrobactrum sp. SFR4]|uniref:hypothetical protein n=1 Tax=Ochrobactrum sp. SFR4 TaxID=2717368 RepID=UPI001C8CA229|nr:hypothetical protein [Ochrobactrum sp. SFR4]MBX8825011.1 hypothetical protein [Ochrobactrum sp. SFR4]
MNIGQFSISGICFRQKYGALSGINHTNNDLPESFFRRILFESMNRPSDFSYETLKTSNMHDMSVISAPQYGEKPEKLQKIHFHFKNNDFWC